ncbi:MAG TPA: hypothetical protein VIY86_14345, partial [Pirellulaceae bacterium]
MLYFSASYAVAWVLEWVRAFFRTSLPLVASSLFVAVGIAVHSAYVTFHIQDAWQARKLPLASWSHWCVLAAWVLALVCLSWKLLRPRTSSGFFVLPLILGLIFTARIVDNDLAFTTSGTSSGSGIVHGLSLLLGIVATHLGCVTGTMYLIQSRRLKRKLPTGHGLRLPSLEWLERATETALFCSLVLLL